ncbi:phosphoenolpyruvate--protein phosphotransferase [Notoacmeibacter sp. MSK16QG-6]|uniref:phosphoenolpyruvate--protein phosphotransferase n=1 Tax=Notoacmeibacter sp. MSK16QG-6 TaxID=2957982 RepID=UPI0020A11A89|nr:phosphoenolpyruvate--protein phosphotransferase [Notoacmeibacter sp. MSK16QG-6]MCP1199938.1 phosphoenolpyruvate--protein phosphotransferase [Notoacmeibacter sp. MSK16QG-6]
MTDFAVGPRVLLRRLRELMAEPLDAQTRLDRIVAEIARNMVAEVCSLYVLRADEVLELYATEGLNPMAVHLASLRVGQGLVGTIAASARTLNLPEAEKHPAFRYLPETGEEAFSSFLGVPVLRAGRTLGVLTVQNKTKRVYREEELEAMQTVSMVLAEMMASGDLANLSRAGIELDMRRPITFDGVAISDGVGLGYVVLHEPRIVVTNLFAEDVELEMSRLHDALGQLRISIDDMLNRDEISADGEHRAVLEAYRMFAHDTGWVRRLEEAVQNGLTAEGAVEKVQNDTRARMIHVADPYIRERMNDFDDLANRLLRQLVGAGRDALLAADDNVIVARTMGAAELLDYPRDRIRGLVLEDGAITSHISIVARAMGIPVTGQTRGVVSMSENGDAIIVDGDEGRVHLRPPADLESLYAEKVRFRAKRQELYQALHDKPARTRDGIDIKLMMNAGLVVDMSQLEESGADGIGLFRTELQFMVASTFPRADRQEELYRDVIEKAGDRPILFRTLDIGGDKVLPYFRNAPHEDNPAMGWRAIRLTLDRAGLFRTQIRALLRAGRGQTLSIMLPMVTEITEIEQARDLIEREKNYLTRHGYDLPSETLVGVMLEVPSLIWQMDRLAGLVDFVSVGSNDLFQFIMATDRGNPVVGDRYDVLSCTFLRALRHIVKECGRLSIPLSLCGEMASRPIMALALAGIGFRTLSMSAASIGPVKATLREVDLDDLGKKLNAAIDHSEKQNIRRFLADYAEKNGLTL